MKKRLLLLVLGCHAAAALAQAPFDIVGLKLGMTEQEAMAALQAHDSTLNITRVASFYNYSDGVETFQTDEFLGEIQAKRQQSQQVMPEFSLLFSPPPQGGRLWAVTRREQITANPPSIAQYAQTLEQKYGKPTAVSPGQYSMNWIHPADGPACLARDPQRPGFPTFRPGRDGDLLFILRAANQRNASPPDYATCGAHLYYILSTTTDDVVSSFEAIMFDIGHQVTANAQAEQQVKALEDAARKAREGKGQMPTL